MKSKQKIIFIVGTSFSGSTLVGSSLDGAEKVTFLSEVDRFVVFNRHTLDYLEHSCTVCEMTGHQESCPIFGLNRIHVISQITTTIGQYIELLKPISGSIVDSSKSIDWFNCLFDNGLNEYFDCFVIITVRNPIAYAYSVAGAISSEYWQGAIAWRETYQHILHSLIARRVPFIVCPYEMLFQPESILMINSGISAVTNHEIELNLSCGSIEHALGGNLSAYLAKVSDAELLWERAQCFDKGNAWKVDKNNLERNKVTESTRWLSIDKEIAYQLLDLPGVLDLAVLFGYTNLFFSNYLNRIK